MRYKKSQESVQAYERMVKTVCKECFVGCGLKFFVKDNQIVDLAGDEDHPLNKGSVCPRGARIMEALVSKSHSPALCTTVKEAFCDTSREISWDKGINYVADQLDQIQKEFGKDALTILITKPNNFTNNFLGLRFAKVFGTNKAAAYEPMKGASNSAGFALGGFKGALTNPPHDWLNSKVILVLGSEISSEVILMGFLLDAQEKGAKIICVDTKYSSIMVKADYPVIINPGTFDSFLQGIIATIITEELYDAKTVKRWAEGLGDLKRTCYSYDLEAEAKRCGIKAEVFSSIARLFAKDYAAQVIGAIREEQAGGSEQMAKLAHLAISLLALNNSLGVRGGGWNWLGTGNPPFTGGTDEVDNVISTNQDCEDLLNEIIEQDTCKALIWDGYIPDEITNEKVIKALEKLKLVVHLSDKEDIARKYAHVSFPVTNWLEEEGPVVCSHIRAIQWQNKVLQAPGERKPAGLFWVQLAGKMGYQKWFPWNGKDNGLDIFALTKFYADREVGIAGLSELNPENYYPGGLLWPCLSKEDGSYDDNALIKGRWLLYRYDLEYPGTKQCFPTNTGKVKLINGFCTNTINKDSKKDTEKYPYSLVVCSSPGFLGTTSLSYEVNSKFVIAINPKDASKLNIQDGEKVVLENEKKEVLKAPAWLTGKVPECKVGLIDAEEPSYYARFCYRGGWIEGIGIRIIKN